MQAEHNTDLPPEDRMPTVEEIRTFDAVAAWDRLTPEQQRQLGVLAVHMAALGVPPSFQNEYAPAELREIDGLACDAITLFIDSAEPLLHLMFGWTDRPASAGDVLAYGRAC